MTEKIIFFGLYAKKTIKKDENSRLEYSPFLFLTYKYIRVSIKKVIFDKDMYVVRLFVYQNDNAQKTSVYNPI